MEGTKRQRARFFDWLTTGLVLACTLLWVGCSRSPALVTLSRVVLSPDAPGNQFPDRMPASLSAEGRFVAFEDVGQAALGRPAGQGVFLFDRMTGEVIPVSFAYTGTYENGSSGHPTISADGRWIVYDSISTDLVENDTNAISDIFLYDHEAEKITLISAGQGGSPANGASSMPRISSDGRFVVFESAAENLVEGDSNGRADIYLYSLETQQFELISAGFAGTENLGRTSDPFVSADGRYVTYYAETNGGASVALFLHDRDENKTIQAAVIFETVTPGFYQELLRWPAYVSTDGSSLMYSLLAIPSPGETMYSWEVHIQNMQTGKSEIMLDPGDQQPVHTEWAAMTPDGGTIVFSSWEPLVGGDTNELVDIFRRNQNGKFELVSRAFSGAPGDRSSERPGLSADGQHIAFISHARNLLDKWDLNGLVDLYIVDLEPPAFNLAPSGGFEDAPPVTDPYPAPGG